MDSEQGFTPALLDNKLKELTSSMHSIQDTSQWLIRNRKQAKLIVKVWYREMQKADSKHKLTLMYLANDVIQMSKKKGPEFKLEFLKVLPRCFQMVSRDPDGSLLKSVERIVNVWEERKVLDGEVIIRLKSLLVASTLKPHRRSKSESDAKRKTSSTPGSSSGPDSKKMRLERRRSSEEDPPNDRKPPETEELLQRLKGVHGDASAMRDMKTRTQIANLPEIMHNASMLSEVKDKDSAVSLSKHVDEAVVLLEEYNKRLQTELKERGEIQELLDAYVWKQLCLMRSAKKKLKEYQTKMEKMSSVKDELKSHLASLPDFTLQGPETGSLAPLPAVGDLFS